MSDPNLREALVYADAATSVLLALQGRSPRDGDLHSDLDRTHDLAEVHQATGMIAVQAAVGLTGALLLRARAFSSERTLLDVAIDVVARTLRFGPEDAHDR